MREIHRAEYLDDLRTVVHAQSAWLLRDFLQRHSSTLGKLGSILLAKTDPELKEFLLELEHAKEGTSQNQLALQLCAPWLLPPYT
jgi:hypothetical protein